MYYGKEKYLPEGRISEKTNAADYLSTKEAIARAISSGVILEATALRCDSELTLHFDLCGKRGIMEKNEALYCRPGEYIKDIAIITRVGKPVCFKIMSVGYDRQGEYLVLSRRMAQLDCVMNYISDLICGDIIPARVTHLESFGAFADIGCGISSLMTVDSISVSRISHPSDRLLTGSDIYAVVKAIDRETGRLFISERELFGTWEQNAANFTVGNTVPGIVRSIESYGVFIELAPNLAGLAEIRQDGKNLPSVSVGQRVAVYIKNIIPEKMKVKLVIINTFPEDISEKPARIEYFIDCERITHLNRWLYSPADCNKVVESVFERV